MIKIAYLADHPEVIPTLVKWFQAQWPAYYAGRTPEDIGSRSQPPRFTDFPVKNGRDPINLSEKNNGESDPFGFELEVRIN